MAKTDEINLKCKNIGDGKIVVDRLTADGKAIGKYHAKRVDVSALKFQNTSAAGPANTITVRFVPVVKQGIQSPSPFGSVPPARTLNPGESFELALTQDGKLDYTTDPPTSKAGGDSDIHIC